VFALLSAPSWAAAQERVIVDSDMGVVNDDAVALFMLLNSPNVEVLGVTIVPGNSWVENGTAAALRQLELLGRTDVPVFMGVREPLMGSRQPWLEAEERLWGHSEFLGAYSRPRPESYLALDREPVIGYPTTKPAAERGGLHRSRSQAHPNEVTLFLLVRPPTSRWPLQNPDCSGQAGLRIGGAIDVQNDARRRVQLVVRSRVDPHHLARAVPGTSGGADRVAERIFYKGRCDRIAAAPGPRSRSCSARYTARASADPASRSSYGTH
jgi:hypothetical protein